MSGLITSINHQYTIDGTSLPTEPQLIKGNGDGNPADYEPYEGTAGPGSISHTLHKWTKGLTETPTTSTAECGTQLVSFPPEERWGYHFKEKYRVSAQPENMDKAVSHLLTNALKGELDTPSCQFVEDHLILQNTKDIPPQHSAQIEKIATAASKEMKRTGKHVVDFTIHTHYREHDQRHSFIAQQSFQHERTRVVVQPWFLGEDEDELKYHTFEYSGGKLTPSDSSDRIEQRYDPQEAKTN